MSKYPVIIFEGPDRSGKSTIAELLAKRLDSEVFMTNSRQCFSTKENSRSLSTFNYHLAKYVSDLSRKNELQKPVIIYRSFLSEMVYAELLGRETNNVLNARADRIFSRVGALLVLTKNSSFDDDSLNNDLVEKSIYLYNKYKANIKCELLEIDTSGHDVEAYANKIIQKLVQR